MSVSLEDVPCPNSCEACDETLFVARDRIHGLPGEFQVVKCLACGLIRTNPRPTPDTIGFYYPDNYGPYVGTQVSGGARDNPQGLTRILLATYHRLIDFKTTALPPVHPGRVLEIGCASGSFMTKMKSQGWEAEGIEFSPSAAESARKAGHRVHTGALESAPDPKAPYDLIVGWMVVEHLHDPLGALSKLSEWGEPGAWLAISVPDVGAKEFSLFGPAGFAMHIPNHLYHFTPDTLESLLQRTGWKVERVTHQRVLTSWWGGIGNLLEDNGAPGWLSRFFKERMASSTYLNIVLYPLAWIVASFGQSGRITVWARKAN